MGFGDFLARVGQGLNDFSDHAREYNEDTLLLQKYGRNWRQYAAAANARVQAEIDEPARQKVKDQDAHNDSESRRKMAEAQLEEQKGIHARQLYDDVLSTFKRTAVRQPDGTYVVPAGHNPGLAPELYEQGRQAIQDTLTSEAQADDAKHARTVREESERNTREAKEQRGNFDYQLSAQEQAAIRAEQRRAAERSSRGLSEAQARAAVMAEVRLLGPHARAKITPEEIESRTQQMMQNGHAAAPADDSNVPAYLLREGMGRATDFGSIGSGSLGGAPAEDPTLSKLSPSARASFDRILASGDQAKIAEARRRLAAMR